MNAMLAGTIAAAMIFGGPAISSAQDAHGFVVAQVNSNENSEQIPGFGVGVLFDFADSWISVGGQADLLTKNGYFGGRGGPIAQANLIRKGPLRLFTSAGFAWGHEDGPMLGAGIEVNAMRKVAFRMMVHDYFQQMQGLDCTAGRYPQWMCDGLRNGGRPYTAHLPGVQFGFAWR